MNSDARRGVLYGIGAYGLWGVFPLYFRLLERSGAVEVVAAPRAVVAARLPGRRGRRPGLGASCARRSRCRGRSLTLGVGAVLLAVNWGVYIYAVNSGQVVEASLGYYINPLVTVLLGVLVLRERLRRAQWVAVGVGAARGRRADRRRTAGPPLIALTLALSFGLYGLIKNRVGAAVGALASLTTETLVLAPVAAALLVWLELTGQGHFTDNPPWQALLLASVGVATVVPLLFFAAAARRVPLSTVGLLQYLTPTLQLLCGVLLLGERMSAGPLGRLRARLGRAHRADRRHRAGRLPAPRRRRTSPSPSAPPDGLISGPIGRPSPLAAPRTARVLPPAAVLGDVQGAATARSRRCRMPGPAARQPVPQAHGRDRPARPRPRAAAPRSDLVQLPRDRGALLALVDRVHAWVHVGDAVHPVHRRGRRLLRAAPRRRGWRAAPGPA